MEWIDEADAVFRGGGVKGLALAGALVGFAEHPTKPVHTWKNVAGASAGAIIACYLATGHDAHEMLDLMRKTNFEQFADFPLHNKLLGVGRLLVRHGMAPGDAFERWFDDVLGGATFAGCRSGDTWSLKLIACDVTSKRLLVLPDDLPTYRDPKTGKQIDPDAFRISRAARMSMSIPYFFQPVELLDAQGNRCTIVDGGTLSNFPVWLFDVDPAVSGRPPSRPTFGFTLKGGKGLGGEGLVKLMPWGLRFAFDIFHTAQEAWDERFVSHSTRVRTLAVDAADVGTTEFDLSPERQMTLVRNGEQAARAFLDQFSLEDYENTFHAKLAEPALATT
ncbi:MAG: patatin-like phospholipase family protein [Actinobacteria bacterium]|nr:patatin-like phospholipase family protein [Actinomycetota bacterium]